MEVFREEVEQYHLSNGGKKGVDLMYAVPDKLTKLVEDGLAEKHPKFRGEYQILGNSEDVENQEQVEERNITERFDDYAEIVGSGIGGVLGFLAGDMMAAAFGSAAGPVVARILKNIGQEFSKRQLSPQEDYRVGKVLAIAALEIHQRIENGESLRNDGFFDKKPIGRSDAEEVAEAITLKCQREPQEKKILYMGFLKASLGFDSDISVDMGHQLIKAAEELTYRQLCILKLAVVKHRFGLRDQNYQDCEKFSKELYQVLQECHDLCLKNYLDYKIPVTFRGEIAVGYVNLQPNNITIQGIGEDLFKLMKLSLIPDEDIIPIAKVLK